MDELLEQIASIIHREWCVWSQELARKETLSEERLARWGRLWATPYANLSEEEKEQDREWARQMLEAVRQDAERKKYGG